MSAQEPNICFAKQILRKMRIPKNREELLMTFLLSLFWNKWFFRGKNLNEAQLNPLIAFLLPTTDRFLRTSPKVELLLILGAYTIICESKDLEDCPLDTTCKLVLKTWRHFLKSEPRAEFTQKWKLQTDASQCLQKHLGTIANKAQNLCGSCFCTKGN